MTHALALLLVTVVVGCPAPFSRPVSGEAEYKQRFLSNLEPGQITELQFTYHGAVGGELSVARFVGGPDVITRLRATTQSEGRYDPSDEPGMEELKRQIRMCSRGGKIPDWFDFPFHKPMPVFSNRGDFSDEHPAYSHQWYADEDEPVVYFILVRG